MRSPADLTFADLHEGRRWAGEYSITREIWQLYRDHFADRNPLHLAGAPGAPGDAVMHGAILSGFLSHAVGMRLPGRRAMLLSVDLAYPQPCFLGDRVHLELTVRQRVETRAVVVLSVAMKNLTRDTPAARGRAQVLVRDLPEPPPPSPDEPSRVAIVTGAARGLGRELAVAFAAGGWSVVGLVRAEAAELARDLPAARLLVGDVTVPLPELASLPEVAAADELALIHSAGAPFQPRPLHLTSWDELEAQLTTAVKGAHAVVRVLLSRLVAAQRATVVTVLSSSLADPPRGFTSQLTAKSALEGFTRALAAEYRPRGVRVFAVRPPYMETPLTSGWDERMRSAVREASGGAADPAEVARAIRALVEDDALPADGEGYAVP